MRATPSSCTYARRRRALRALSTCWCSAGLLEPDGGWASLADALVAEHDLAAPTVIEVPLRSIFTSSTTHLPALEIIGELDRLTGVAQADFVSSEAVRAMLDADELAVFAPTYVVDAEIVLAHRPDVVMTSGFWDDAYEVVAGAGTAIVHNGDWVESSPLGRAEWVKFISLFFNREAEAEAWYEQVRANYLAARELAGSVETTAHGAHRTGLGRCLAGVGWRLVCGAAARACGGRLCLGR